MVKGAGFGVDVAETGSVADAGGATDIAEPAAGSGERDAVSAAGWTNGAPVIGAAAGLSSKVLARVMTSPIAAIAATMTANRRRSPR